MKNSDAPLLGRIHSLESFGAVDGPGVRYVIFFQGCGLRCIYCHNPDTWDRGGGTMMSVDELVEKVLPYRPFFRRGGGVTLTGGEPLLQSDFVLALTRALHRHGLHVAIDTAGAVPTDVCGGAVDEADMLLLDIKAFDPSLCRLICGDAGDSAKALLRRCEDTGKPVWLRHVVVPGYTMKPELLSELARYLRGFSCIERVELLPFHQLGSYKWEQLGYPYALEDHAVPGDEDMRAAREIFLSAGLNVQ